MSESLDTSKIDLDIIESLFDLMDKDELVLMAKIVAAVVPGFSQKKLHNAPQAILKKQSLLKIKKKGNYHTFIEGLTSVFESEFSNLSMKELGKKLKLHQEITPAQSYLLILKHHTQFFYEHRDLLEKNARANEFILQGIVDDEPSLEEYLHALLGNKMSNLEKILEQWSEGNKDSTLLQEFEKYTSIKDALKDLGEFEGRNGYWVHLLKYFYQEFKKECTEKEKAQILTLSFQELLSQQIKLTHTFDELEQELTQTTDTKNELQTECLKLKEKYNTLTVQLEESKRTITEKEKIETENIMLQKKYDELKNESIFDQLNFVLFSKSSETIYSLALNNNQFQVYRSIEELIDLIRNVTEEKMLFINEDGISNKDQFLIENKLRKNDVRFKWVSGHAKAIIRRIAYYMEGELRYEISQSNE